MLIPFKGESQKTRLSRALGAAQRRRFSLLMLEGVLRAVEGAGLASSCHLVSSDETALGLARKAGGSAVFESESTGVNAAVSLGMKRAGAERYLILPADLPLLAASDIEKAVDLGSRRASVVISPSRHLDGTNLLLFSRARGVRLSYDSNSFWNHLGRAAGLGVPVAVYTGRGAVFDVDTVDDLRELGRLPPDSAAADFARRAMEKRVSS